MLRTDFNGYKEFEKKLMNAKGIELLSFLQNAPGYG